MNVLHISTPRSWRGGEQQLWYLVNELNRMGVGSHIFCANGSPLADRSREAGQPFTTFIKRASLDPNAALQMRRTCLRSDIDLIHAHDSHAHTMACVAASVFGSRVPIVVSRRVDFPIRGRLSKWKYNHRMVRRILCVSKAICDVMEPAVRDRTMLRVVHSGIDLTRFEARPDGRLRREFGIPAERPIVANVAALAPHKDYRTFVETAAELVRSGSDAMFLAIGGEGGERAMIESLIDTHGLNDRIILTGFREDIPIILPEIDLFLFTSTTEGLGTSLLDAFAAGVPVVATAAGGVPEIVRNGETGLLAPVGDAAGLARRVREVLKHASLREQLVAGARKLVREFSTERTAEKTLDIYRSVLSRPAH